MPCRAAAVALLSRSPQAVKNPSRTQDTMRTKHPRSMVCRLGCRLLIFRCIRLLSDIRVILTAVSQDELQVLQVQTGGKAVIPEHIGNKLTLEDLQFADFLFYGVAGNEAISNDLF